MRPSRRVDAPPPNILQLRNGSRSAHWRERLLALRTMRRQIDEGRSKLAFLRLASRLIHDKSNACRWQALIVVGEFVREYPDRVWSIFKRAAPFSDDDLRDGLAAVILEHLLEHHFESTLSQLRACIREGDDTVADILSRCWPFGAAKRKWQRVEAILAKWHDGSIS